MHLSKGLALALTLSACGASTYVNFEPSSAEYVSRGTPAQTVRVAVRVYEKDLAPLAQCEGQVLGIIRVSGNKWANGDDIRARAASYAATLGATHYFLRDSSVNTQMSGIIQTSPNTAVPAYSSSISAAYAIIVVEPRRWVDLPRYLRPRPWGR